MKKVSYKEVVRIVDDILARSGADLRDIEFVVGVSRGGLFPAMVVSTALVKPLAIAYIDKQDNVYFDRVEWLNGKRVLLVDDIVRTGKTIGKIKELLLKEGVLCVTTFTPYYLEAVESHAPDYGFVVREDIAFPWD